MGADLEQLAARHNSQRGHPRQASCGSIGKRSHPQGPGATPLRRARKPAKSPRAAGASAGRPRRAHCWTAGQGSRTQDRELARARDLVLPLPVHRSGNRDGRRPLPLLRLRRSKAKRDHPRGSSQVEVRKACSDLRPDRKQLLEHDVDRAATRRRSSGTCTWRISSGTPTTSTRTGGLSCATCSDSSALARSSHRPRPPCSRSRRIAMEGGGPRRFVDAADTGMRADVSTCRACPLTSLCKRNARTDDLN